MLGLSTVTTPISPKSIASSSSKLLSNKKANSSSKSLPGSDTMMTFNPPSLLRDFPPSLNSSISSLFRVLPSRLSPRSAPLLFLFLFFCSILFSMIFRFWLISFSTIWLLPLFLWISSALKKSSCAFSYLFRITSSLLYAIKLGIKLGWSGLKKSSQMRMHLCAMFVS